MLWALKMRYRDISEITGDSATRVSQLVARANLEIHESLRERAHHERESSPRAERLWQLEHEQSEWLVSKIGRFQNRSRRNVSQASRQRAWRRAALALDDLRDLAGPNRFEDALERRPADPTLRRAHDAALRALENFDHERSRERGRRIGD